MNILHIIKLPSQLIETLHFPPAIMTSKDILIHRLEKLLGFDGVEDILEHLLTIESEQDLLDYLSQLLGNDGTDVKLFVADVGQFKKGETLSPIELPLSIEDLPPPDRKLQDNYIDSKSVAAKPQKKSTAATKRIVGTKKQQPVPPVKNLLTTAQKPPPTNEREQGVAKLSKNEETTEIPVKKHHPPKGKASVVCGCFGTLHAPLTNCLYCGRISCSREGYDFCAFCGLLVERVEAKSGDVATQHLERLLRFDRDFARRTVVLDDQADYFSNQTSTWLTEEEQSEAAKSESDRRTELHTRKKQSLNLNF